MPATDPAAYDPFARCYARWWGPEFAERFLPVLERVLLQDLPAGARLLDLCCGTGDLAALLTQRGFCVSGVDGSERVLAYARRRAPDASFLNADARAFTLPRAQDAAFCSFDSLNHVLDARDLARVFRCVHTALTPGGVFAFDLNTEASYRDQWHDTFGHAADDLACVVVLDYDPRRRLGTFRAAVFELEPDGTWRRQDVRLVQRAHAPEAVAGALRGAGFVDVACYDARHDLGLTGSVGRVVYVARRSAVAPTAASRE